MHDRRPDADYVPRTPIASLRTAELLVVTTLRLWVAPHRAPQVRHPDWRGGLDAARIAAPAATSFDALLRILAACASRRLDVRCPRCRELGEDEARLLRLLRSLQSDRREPAAAILDLWLPPAAARMALGPAAGFAHALAEAGLFIPPRPPVPAVVMAEGRHASADPGTMPVH
jgi:hypothetical protein